MLGKTLITFGLLAACVACLVQAGLIEPEEVETMLQKQSPQSRLKELKENFVSHDWKLSFYVQAPYMETSRSFVEMYKQGQEYAGNFSVFYLNQLENVQFVTEGDERFVHGFKDPVIRCRREDNNPFLEELLDQLVKVIDEGRVSKSNLLLPVEEPLHMIMADEGKDVTIHFDLQSEPIRVHSLYFGRKTLPGLELSFIKIEFNPTIPGGMFEVPGACRNEKMQEMPFFGEVLIPIYAKAYSRPEDF